MLAQTRQTRVVQSALQAMFAQSVQYQDYLKVKTDYSKEPKPTMYALFQIALRCTSLPMLMLVVKLVLQAMFAQLVLYQDCLKVMTGYFREPRLTTSVMPLTALLCTSQPILMLDAKLVLQAMFAQLVLYQDYLKVMSDYSKEPRPIMFVFFQTANLCMYLQILVLDVVFANPDSIEFKDLLAFLPKIKVKTIESCNLSLTLCARLLSAKQNI